MIVSGTLMLDAPPTRVRLAEGWLRVEGGRIVEVVEGDCPHQADLGGGGTVITPGFVDAHLHLPQFDSIGADGLTLLDWLERVIFPAEMRWADADYAEQMTHRVIDQLLAHGTTAFAGYATVHHEATRAAMRAAEQRNVRAVIGQVLMDQQAPAELTRPTDQLLREAASFFDRPPHPRVRPAVTPRFALTCSEPLLRGCGDLAAKYHAIIQTHLAETEPECRRAAELHGGLRYTEIYRRAGLLTPRSLLAHAIWLDHADRRTLAAADAVLAHCPTANAFLRSGTMDRSAHHAAGLRTALGSDIAGGPDRSMPRVARSMIQTAKSLGHPPPPAAEAWRQITTTNAATLGLPHTARLAPNHTADLLILHPDIPWQTAPDPLGMLLYAWDDRWLKNVMLAGDVVVES